MSLVRRLTRHAQRLGDMPPRPALRGRRVDGVALHPVGKPPKGDDRGNRGGGIVRAAVHASDGTPVPAGLSIYVDSPVLRHR